MKKKTVKAPQAGDEKELAWQKTFFDALPDKLIVLNLDRTIQCANQTLLRSMGVSLQEVCGRPCYEVIHRAGRICASEKGPECPFDEVLRTRKGLSVIHEHEGPDGRMVFEEVTATPILDGSGEVTQVIEGIRNVTRRVTLERDLRDSEQKLRQFLESAHDVISIKDLEGRYLYVNPAAAEAMDMPREEILGKTAFEIFSKGLAESMTRHDGETLSQKKTLFVREKMEIRGKTRLYHTVRFPIWNDSGQIISFAVVSRDMTEEMSFQEEARRHKEYLENILSNSSDMIITTDLKGNIVTFNPGGEHMLGYTREEVSGKSIETLWKTPEDRRALMEEVNRKGAVSNYPATLIAKDGREVDISLSLAQLRDSEERVLGTVGVSKDITEENRLRQELVHQERELRKAHDFLNKVIRNSPNAIIATDQQGDIMIWNPAAEEILGYPVEEVVGKMNIDRIYPKGMAKKVMKLMRTPEQGPPGKLRSYPMVYVRRDGGIVEGNLSAAIIYDEKGQETASVGVFVDLEERLSMERKLRQTQEQLLQSEKLAAMGRLTSQIAHELNNPLYGIMNTLELLKTEVPPESKRRRILEMALSETVRLSDMLRKMLSFSKPEEERRQPTDINAILDEILLLHEKQLREYSIALVSDLAPDLGLVNASKNQLRQVFLNMIGNARDAMPEGGTLTVSTRPAGEVIEIAITDTGAGIREEYLDKIFDAFFTTKDSVKGVGLGLSVCYGFIRDHGGQIRVTSQVGSGSTFYITLPILKEEE